MQIFDVKLFLKFHKLKLKQSKMNLCIKHVNVIEYETDGCIHLYQCYIIEKWKIRNSGLSHSFPFLSSK